MFDERFELIATLKQNALLALLLFSYYRTDGKSNKNKLDDCGGGGKIAVQLGVNI